MILDYRRCSSTYTRSKVKFVEATPRGIAVTKAMRTDTSENQKRPLTNNGASGDQCVYIDYLIDRALINWFIRISLWWLASTGRPPGLKWHKCWRQCKGDLVFKSCDGNLFMPKSIKMYETKAVASLVSHKRPDSNKFAEPNSANDDEQAQGSLVTTNQGLLYSTRET